MNEFKISELKSRKWNDFKERLQDNDENIKEIVEDMKDDFTEHEIEFLLLETGRDNNTKTKVLLEDGITIGGKSLVDHLEIVGHSKAIEYLEDMKDDFTEHEIEFLLLETGRDNNTKR